MKIKGYVGLTKLSINILKVQVSSFYIVFLPWKNKISHLQKKYK